MSNLARSALRSGDIRTLATRHLRMTSIPASGDWHVRGSSETPTVPLITDRAIARATERAITAFGQDVVRLRQDAGISRLRLARAAGVDDRYLKRIEDGEAHASVEVCVRLGLALGADLVHRLYPSTGPTIRDRHQAPIVEALLATAHARWARFEEIAVYRPSRGWIDLGFHSPSASTFLATEVVSELRRLEQLLRWSEAKADSLPSWEGFPRLGEDTHVSRLLVVRDTRANRSIAREFRRLLKVSFPADPEDALESLAGISTWPGPAVLWAVRNRERAGSYRIVARP